MPYRHPIFSFLGFVVTLITLLGSRGITSAERIDFTVPIGNIIGGQTFFAPVPELPAEPLLVITIRGPAKVTFNYSRMLRSHSSAT